MRFLCRLSTKYPNQVPAAKQMLTNVPDLATVRLGSLFYPKQIKGNQDAICKSGNFGHRLDWFFA